MLVSNNKKGGGGGFEQQGAVIMIRMAPQTHRFYLLHEKSHLWHFTGVNGALNDPRINLALAGGCVEEVLGAIRRLGEKRSLSFHHCPG